MSACRDIAEILRYKLTTMQRLSCKSNDERNEENCFAFRKDESVFNLNFLHYFIGKCAIFALGGALGTVCSKHRNRPEAHIYAR